VKTLNRKKSQGGKGVSTIIRRLQELHELFVRVSVLGLTGRKENLKAPVSLEEKVYLYLTDACVPIVSNIICT